MLDAEQVSRLVINKGHYFGTNLFAEEPGLSDADKRALIGFLKTCSEVAVGDGRAAT